MDAQLLEIAAREYCKINSLNPDERIAMTPQTNSGRAALLSTYGPRWRLVADRLHEHHLLTHCINHALSGTASKSHKENT